MKAIEAINEKQLKNVPDLKPGDTVKVHTKIIEGTKERIQIFEGVVIKVKGSGIKQSFTVRKLSYGIGVERTFLIHSPKLAKIQIVKRAKVRQAYLTYLRGLRGKAAKLKDMAFDSLVVNANEEMLKPEDLAPAVDSEQAETTQPEEDVDAEITEIEPEGADVVEETSTEEIAKEEIKEDAVDAGDSTEDLGAEDQEISVEGTDEGLEKAEQEEEKGKEMQ